MELELEPELELGAEKTRGGRSKVEAMNDNAALQLCGDEKREKGGSRLNFPSLGAGDLTAGAPTRDRPISRQARWPSISFSPFSPFTNRIAGEDGRDEITVTLREGPCLGDGPLT
jgi:hypothetical protein